MKASNTSKRLKEIMQARNLRQVDILRKAEPFCKQYNVKLGKNDLSQYVNGKVEPGQDKLAILGQALNVSEAWLMGYDVPMGRTDDPHQERHFLRISLRGFDREFVVTPASWDDYENRWAIILRVANLDPEQIDIALKMLDIIAPVEKEKQK